MAPKTSMKKRRLYFNPYFSRPGKPTKPHLLALPGETPDEYAARGGKVHRFGQDGQPQGEAPCSAR